MDNKNEKVLNGNVNEKQPDEFTITIVFDNDVEIECSIIAIFPVNNRNYIALLPITKHPDFDPEEVFLYRYSTIGSKDSIKLDTIETDTEYNMVAGCKNTECPHRYRIQRKEKKIVMNFM